MNIVLLGAPGAGKGTQAQKIASRFDCAHVSTGEILRKSVDDRTALGQQAKAYMDRGELVPDSIMIGMIKDFLPSGRGFVLDGFPRTVDQARALDAMLQGEKKNVQIAVNVAVDRETLVQRMLSRGRADDRRETIEKRLEVYEAQTKPVVDYYRQAGKLKEIDGTRPVEAVTDSLVQALGQAS